MASFKALLLNDLQSGSLLNLRICRLLPLHASFGVDESAACSENKPTLKKSTPPSRISESCTFSFKAIPGGAAKHVRWHQPESFENTNDFHLSVDIVGSHQRSGAPQVKVAAEQQEGVKITGSLMACRRRAPESHCFGALSDCRRDKVCVPMRVNCKHDDLLDIAVGQQDRKQFPALLSNTSARINDNESDSRCGCQSELERGAESKPLRFRELLQEKPESPANETTRIHSAGCRP